MSLSWDISPKQGVSVGLRPCSFVAVQWAITLPLRASVYITKPVVPEPAASGLSGNLLEIPIQGDRRSGEFQSLNQKL